MERCVIIIEAEPDGLLDPRATCGPLYTQISLNRGLEVRLFTGDPAPPFFGNVKRCLAVPQANWMPLMIFL